MLPASSLLCDRPVAVAGVLPVSWVAPRSLGWSVAVDTSCGGFASMQDETLLARRQTRRLGVKPDDRMTGLPAG